MSGQCRAAAIRKGSTEPRPQLAATKPAATEPTSFAKRGSRIIIVAGVPLGTPGATNMLRIAFVGSEAGREV